jgi:hypothetical protein
VVRGVGEILAEQVAIAGLAVQIDRGLYVARVWMARAVAISVAMIAISIAEVASAAMIAVVAQLARVAMIAGVALLARFARRNLARLACFARLTGLTGLTGITRFARLFLAHARMTIAVRASADFELSALAATTATTPTSTTAVFTTRAAGLVEPREDRIIVVGLGRKDVRPRKRRTLRFNRQSLGFARFACFARHRGRGGITITCHGMLPECEYAGPHLDDTRLAPVLLDQSR